MKKNLALCLSVCALVGLSACNESDSSDKNGDKRCQNNAIEIYTNGHWEIETQCEGASVCNEMTHVCEVATDCTDGDKRCENNAVEVCADKLWTLEKACENLACDDATHTCIASNCDSGWERCNGDIIEACNDRGVYEAVTPAACSADTRCLGDTVAHTAICVECKNNSDCTSSDAPVCHSNHSCVACKVGEKSCQNNALVECNANGAWPSTGMTCDDGQHCVDGNNACTSILGECIDNVDADKCMGNTWMTCIENTWVEDACAGLVPVCSATEGCVECVNADDCKDPAKPVCSSNKCVAAAVCTENVDADKCMGNVWMSCFGGAWESIDCTTDAEGPYCLPEKMCVKCTDNSHCGTGTCNTTTNQCVYPIICEANTSRCTGEVYEECNAAGTAYDSINCPVEFPDTPYCHPTEWCVECSDNSHCGTGTCNTTTNECVAAP